MNNLQFYTIFQFPMEYCKFIISNAYLLIVYKKSQLYRLFFLVLFPNKKSV